MRPPPDGRHGDRPLHFAFNLLLPLAVLGWLGCDGGGTGVSPPLLMFGRTGMGAGEFSYPRAAVATPEGDFYVVDKAARIQRFTPGGELVCAWEMPARSAGKPTGLGIGPDGRVYVADTHYSRVLIFDSCGEQLGEFGSFGQEPGQFGLPTDVAVDREGCIYVSEYGLIDRVSKFSPQLEFLFSIGGPDGPVRFRRPQALLIDADDTLWVSDSCQHRICQFDSDGRFLQAFGRSGSALGEMRFPYGMDWLSDGTLVVAEYGNNRIQRFDRQGRSQGFWGRAGRGAGELAYPWAVVVGPEDHVIVIDSGNNRVQIFDGRASGSWRRPTQSN